MNAPKLTADTDTTTNTTITTSMSLPVTDGVLAAAIDLSGGGLPSYTHGQRDRLLHEAYRLHFIYNAAHKQPAASTTSATTTTIRSLAALPLFFEHYDATGVFLALQGPPFAATDPCAADPVRLAAAADAFFAATLRFWRHPAVVARKAQLVAREAYLDDCPRVPSTSNNTSTSTTGSGPDGIIDDADITTVTVADMEAVQDALEQVSREAKEARGVVRRMDRFADPEVDHLLEALSDVGGNVREILEAVKEVEGIFVEGGFE